MKLLLLLLVFVLSAGEAKALPKCSRHDTQTSFLGNWKKGQDGFELAFTCLNKTKAAVSFENQMAGDGHNIYFILDAKGQREGEDVYDDPCDAIRDYCETGLDQEETTPDARMSVYEDD